jgi:hypothetical protein
MIQNIIDNRKRQHRWKRINAVVEPTWHDNKVTNSDRAEPATNESDYDERSGISLAEAVVWAQGLPYPLTIHLYDEDEVPPNR